MKKILTIDGGGIKGVFPAAFLADLEEDLGEPLVDYFDLIVGTSTGGIIAIGLGLGLSAHDILGFYEDRGPEIFSGGSGLRRLRQVATAKYNPAPLRHALEDVFGDRKLGESKTRLVIPSLNLETGDVHVLKTAHHPRFERDYKLRAVDVALATAAAPTYFPTHRLAAGIPLVDGGMWANNPMGPAAVEAVGLLEWSAGDIKLLSLGCTDAPLSADAERTRGLGVNYWVNKLVKVFMAGQSSSSIGTAQLLLGHDNVMRISPKVDDKRFSLDNPHGIEALRALGSSQSRIDIPRVRAAFFTEKAEPFIPVRQLNSKDGAA